ncbi:MAG: hypothetical protein IJN48_03400, partial [Clostridia bacterium]|nr:hypothetical protein [Clostridia bacterium]
FTLAACGNKSDIEVPMGMQLASNESVPDYIMMVPSDWTVEESTGTTTAYYKDNLSGAVVATLSATFVAPPSADTTLDNYFDSYSEEFGKVFGETEPEISTTTLGGEEARRYIYSATFNNIEYSFWQEICMHEGRIYTVTYSTPSEYFEKFAEDMEVTLEYFSFTE